MERIPRQEVEGILINKYPQIYVRLKRLTGISVFKSAETIADLAVFKHNESGLIVELFTSDYKYYISVRRPLAVDDSDPGYIGCGRSARRALPGENLTRGCDLPDGPYSLETMDKIIYAILSSLIVPVPIPSVSKVFEIEEREINEGK